MKFLIVGRSGAGKDTLTSYMSGGELKKAKSYTTRPRRYPGEDGYHFVSADIAAEMKNKFAKTVVNGYEYFLTESEVDNSDLIIVDPEGVREIISQMPGTAFIIVYIERDNDKAREKAISRGSDPVAEAKIWEKRIASEAPRFDAFEKALRPKKDFRKVFGLNCVGVEILHNDFDRSWLHDTSNLLRRRFNVWKHTYHVVRKGLGCDLIPTYMRTEGIVRVLNYDGRYAEILGSEEKADVTPDVFVQFVLADDKLMALFARNYFESVKL